MVGASELKSSGFSYVGNKIKLRKTHKNLKGRLWRLWLSWNGMTLHLDQENNFLSVLVAVYSNFEARSQYFIFESKNITLKYYLLS